MAERCNGQGELVFSYVEGTLAKDESEQFRRHLEQCPACRRLHGDFQRVAERARLLPPGHTPEQEERVLRAKARFSWNIARAIPALALVAAVVFGVVWWRSGAAKVEPPRIEHAAPNDAEGLEPGDRLRFIFSKDMDPGSVAAALRVEPALHLLAVWDGRTLNLTLPPDVRRPATYEVTIGTDATDTEGNPLTAGATLRFSTSPAPDVLVFGEEVPWSPEEVTDVQLQVDAGAYDFRLTPELAVERDLGWMIESEERAEYGEPTVMDEQQHLVKVQLLRLDGQGYMVLTVEQLGGKRDTDPWFVTYREEFMMSSAVTDADAEAVDDATDEAADDNAPDDNASDDDALGDADGDGGPG